MSQPASPAPVPAPALSAGTLFYLFGERVAPAAGRFGGVEVPSGAKVSASDLSALLFAASFWNLRQTGALTLQPVTRKALGMFKVPHVELAMGPTVVQKSGYEDLIMRAVAEGRTLAHDVVYHWFRGDSRDPEGAVVGLAKREMVEHGLAQEVDAERGAVGGFLLGKTRIQPDLQACAAYWDHFNRVHPAWTGFTQSEPELAATLVDTCRKAIKQRQESDDDHDF